MIAVVGDAEIDAELAERAALLDGPARAARAVLADDPGEGWTGDRRAVPEALRRVVARLAAEGPLLLIVDDLHWYGGGSRVPAAASRARRKAWNFRTRPLVSEPLIGPRKRLENPVCTLVVPARHTNLCSHLARTDSLGFERHWGTGPTARTAVSKTASQGSIPWSPAENEGRPARRPSVFLSARGAAAACAAPAAVVAPAW